MGYERYFVFIYLLCHGTNGNQVVEEGKIHNKRIAILDRNESFPELCSSDLRVIIKDIQSETSAGYRKLEDLDKTHYESILDSCERLNNCGLTTVWPESLEMSQLCADDSCSLLVTFSCIKYNSTYYIDKCGGHLNERLCPVGSIIRIVSTYVGLPECVKSCDEQLQQNVDHGLSMVDNIKFIDDIHTKCNGRQACDRNRVLLGKLTNADYPCSSTSGTWGSYSNFLRINYKCLEATNKKIFCEVTDSDLQELLPDRNQSDPWCGNGSVIEVQTAVIDIKCVRGNTDCTDPQRIQLTEFVDEHFLDDIKESCDGETQCGPFTARNSTINATEIAQHHKCTGSESIRKNVRVFYECEDTEKDTANGPIGGILDSFSTMEIVTIVVPITIAVVLLAIAIPVGYRIKHRQNTSPGAFSSDQRISETYVEPIPSYINAVAGAKTSLFIPSAPKSLEVLSEERLSKGYMVESEDHYAPPFEAPKPPTIDFDKDRYPQLPISKKTKKSKSPRMGRNKLESKPSKNMKVNRSISQQSKKSENDLMKQVPSTPKQSKSSMDFKESNNPKPVGDDLKKKEQKQVTEDLAEYDVCGFTPDTPTYKNTAQVKAPKERNKVTNTTESSDARAYESDEDLYDVVPTDNKNASTGIHPKPIASKPSSGMGDYRKPSVLKPKPSLKPSASSVPQKMIEQDPMEIYENY